VTRLVIVVPCSGEKASPGPETEFKLPAGELYVGGFHRYARARAEVLADAVLVMSAWYGLISLAFPIPAYDVTIDHPNSIVARPSLIVHQAAKHGLFAPGVVTVSWCPAKYTRELARAIPALVTPFANSRGIGDQRGRIAKASRAELLGEPVGQLELLA
jgi:hypothetical protein